MSLYTTFAKITSSMIVLVVFCRPMGELDSSSIPEDQPQLYMSTEGKKSG